ncbi:MAG TPA: galactokinase [Candidatus Acidoferrales bacterium]|nr:galactokinase [Candidatus Acidoferrales bacterium]
MEARAPGRVNLIGEHTDYNDGFVMPAAISYATHVAGDPTPNRVVNVASESVDAAAAFDLDALETGRAGDWTDYVRGVLIELQRAGVTLAGADLRVTSTVPLGAGLSSSASFEVALALAMLERCGTTMPRIDVAKLARRAEAEHTGTRSGIMDQFAVLFGEAGSATFLDTRSLDYAHVPVPAGVTIVICNTMVKHALAAGAYNERREQCEAAVERLKTWYPDIRALRDVSLEQLEAHAAAIPPILYHRALHVVGENARVLEAKAAFERADPLDFGRLMNASHESLRDDYEVSAPELDVMVALARRCDGVYGARMTGGGFGGCTVNLVDVASVDSFRAAIAKGYYRETGMHPDLYDGTPAAGARAGE